MQQSFFAGILIFCLILPGSLTVCGQSRFTIIGTGQQIHNGDILYLSYKEDGKYILDSAVASGTKFTFSGLIRHPVRAHIYRNENPQYVDFITESVQVYLEPGVIRVSSTGTLNNAVIGGTGLNDTLQMLHQRLAGLEEKRRSVKDPDLFTEEEKKDTALLNHNKRELDRIYFEEADRKLAFVKEYPDSYVSLDILADISRINTYIGKVDAAWSRLSEEYKNTPQGKLISERIRKKQQVVAGMKAIDFAMKDVNGKTISLSSFRGKFVLLDFWASWCGPCREEHPNLIRVYEKYKNKGFTIVSVSIDTDKGSWLKAIAGDKIAWTQLSDLKGNQGEIYLTYGITSIPANFLINPDGIVIAKDLKGDLLKNELAKYF